MAYQTTVVPLQSASPWYTSPHFSITLREARWSGEVTRIISVTSPDHRASRRVIEKCGLVYQGEADWRGTTVVWYAIDRARYSSERPRSAGFVGAPVEENHL